MDEKNDGGPAFPVAEHWDAAGCVNTPTSGMTLRDWFAGQALASLTFEDRESCTQAVGGTAEDDQVMAAFYCYRLADAMLAEREK